MSEPPPPPESPAPPPGPVPPSGYEPPPGHQAPSGYQVPPAGHYGPPPISFADPSDPLISPDYAGWWQRNIWLVRAYWRPLLMLQLIAAAVALVVEVPTAVAQALGSRHLDSGSQLSPEQATQAFGSALPWMILGAVGAIIAALAAVAVQLAGMRLLVVAVTGGRPAVGDALRGALRRVFPLIGWGLLAGLILIAGVFACIVPAFYFAAVFLVLPAVVLFERGGVIARCFKLFHADAGAALARVATIVGLGIAASLVAVVFGAILNAVGAASPGVTGPLVATTVISTLFGIVVNAALGVVTAPLTLTTYADERARREPLHTGVLAQELANA
ncbi:hypothetical protein [Planosporangium mesophilum]|uniref:Glycerophosphoryl diester phosphodiesterase membrane domain-containing protein n=1 Tax=Planosporangium mesophilum TaxID=689768 RepID=A0A8J3TFP9_9ACTN|nr:hypothetical protein [Planosporangium mesophilum]NJC83724.1 hypothetical protein [Planosporangium mesophilum]GII26305.1 hypothetical protein Pme01_59020 [Planosporangium mesophilum]